MMLDMNWEGMLNLVRGRTWERSADGFVFKIQIVLNKSEMRLNFPSEKLGGITGMNYPGTKTAELFEKVSKDLKL